jgi:hypothetical protein
VVCGEGGLVLLEEMELKGADVLGAKAVRRGKELTGIEVEKLHYTLTGSISGLFSSRVWSLPSLSRNTQQGVGKTLMG